MEEKRVKFPCGKLSLEGVLAVPDGEGPFPAVIVCHPHPLYGGNMYNNVVNGLSAVLIAKSFVSFKFNFRGVGGSDGEYGQGIGEQEDTEAAISFLTTVGEVDANRIGLAGYSAGATFALPVAARDERVKALAAVSPPLTMGNFDYLKSCLKPKFLIIGINDAFTTTSQFVEFCQSLPEPKWYLGIEQVDHFWSGHEYALGDKVATFFAKAL